MWCCSPTFQRKLFSWCMLVRCRSFHKQHNPSTVGFIAANNSQYSPRYGLYLAGVLAITISMSFSQILCWVGLQLQSQWGLSVIQYSNIKVFGVYHHVILMHTCISLLPWRARSLSSICVTSLIRDGFFVSVLALLSRLVLHHRGFLRWVVSFNTLCFFRCELAILRVITTWRVLKPKLIISLCGAGSSINVYFYIHGGTVR